MKKTLIGIILIFAVGFGAFLLYQVTKEEPSWKTYVNEELKFSIQYHSDMFLPRSPCDSFILASSEEEKNRIKNIRDVGIEIGYEIQGLELGFCIIKPGGRTLTLVDIKEYQPSGVHTNITFAGRDAIQVKQDNFVEIFVPHPSGEMMRIWYRYGSSFYEEIAVKMLSTFNFLG